MRIGILHPLGEQTPQVLKERPASVEEAGSHTSHKYAGRMRGESHLSLSADLGGRKRTGLTSHTEQTDAPLCIIKTALVAPTEPASDAKLPSARFPQFN
ncbi:MAG: hypothetical protein WBQ63_11400, partial [Candidatus Acidiferrales bacterium]